MTVTDRIAAVLVVAAMLVAGTPQERAEKKRQPNLREVVEDAVKRFRTREGGPTVQGMLDVAYCESGGRRRARNGSHYGLFQHAKRYWPERSRRAGFAGASIYNVRAQVGTAAHMIDRNGGWSAWPNCP